MTDEELNALVKRLDDMSDLSRDHAAGLLDLGHKVAVNQAITAITTLRAQLAEVIARADRAEAALAAQIEADAMACSAWGTLSPADMDDGVKWQFDLPDQIASSLRAQPHDRTALDAAIRAAKVEAWKEAANAYSIPTICTKAEVDKVQSLHEFRAAILALIEREGV